MRPLFDEYQAFVSQNYSRSWLKHSKGFEVFPEMYSVLVRSGKFGENADRTIESESSFGLQGAEEMAKDDVKENEAGEVEPSDSPAKSAAPRQTRPRRNTSRVAVSDSDKEDDVASKGESPRSKGVPYVDLKRRTASGVGPKVLPAERPTAALLVPSSPVVGREMSEIAPDPQEVPSNVRPRRFRALSAPADDEGEDEVDELPEESPVPKKKARGRSKGVSTGQKATKKIDTNVEEISLPSDVVSRPF